MNNKSYDETYSALVKQQDYASIYNPNLLFAITRWKKREEMELTKGEPLPFFGVDLWNIYEVSWLNPRRKPIVAVAQIIYPCSSETVIESKSMKLYFNSFNNTIIGDEKKLESIIKKDIQNKINEDNVIVKIKAASTFQNEILSAGFPGICIDNIDVDCTEINENTAVQIQTSNKIVEEVIYSNLLKSNCHVTNQPDWGSVQISYRGPKIDYQDLLTYIISFRNKNEFHEPCIEKIYLDLMRQCQPKKLAVYGRYTRRGGIDINAFRSSYTVSFENNPLTNVRLYRQ